jgi:hypothetical protein
MAEYKPQAVKDVPANDFIKAYAAHLKSTDKVSNLQPSHTWSPGQRRLFQQQSVSDAALEWLVFVVVMLSTLQQRKPASAPNSTTTVGSYAVWWFQQACPRSQDVSWEGDQVEQSGSSLNVWMHC